MPLLGSLKVYIKILISYSFYIAKLKRKKNKTSTNKILEIILDPSLGIGDLIMFSQSISLAKEHFEEVRIFSHFENPFNEDLKWVVFDKNNFHEIFKLKHKPESNVFIPRISPFLVLRLFRFKFLGNLSVNLTQENFFSSSKRSLVKYNSNNFIVMAVRQIEDISKSKASINDIKNFELKSEAYDIQNRYFVLSPSAHENIRKLAPYQWLEISQYLRDKGKLVLVGSNKDIEENKFIFKLIKENNIHILDLTAKTSLANLVHLINKCEALICIDNGPFHLARYLGKKTLSFFGPTDPSSRSIKEKNLIFGYKKELCPNNLSPCAKPVRNQQCPTKKECLYGQNVQDQIKLLDII